MNTASIIIPVKDSYEPFFKVFKSLKLQKDLIKELIVVDSSKSREIESLLKSNADFPSKYIRADNYPGESRNIGVLNASSEIIGFLDSKTIPDENWLSCGINLLDNKYKCVFGVTKYIAYTNVQKIIRASIFGKKGKETFPGTIMFKSAFKDCGPFLEGVRSGEDFEWRERFKDLYPNEWRLNSDSILEYGSISKSFSSEARRQFIYQIHSALIDIQSSAKAFVLGISLIFISLLIPRWNSLVGWDASPLYIDDITKKYFYLMCFVFSILYFFKLFKTPFNRILKRFIFFILILLSIYFVFFWNARIASWDISSVFYIPHVTKIYLVGLITINIFYRGIIYPLKNEISKAYLFPFKWVQVGIVGSLLDLCKFPGYLLGSIFIFFTNKRK